MARISLKGSSRRNLVMKHHIGFNEYLDRRQSEYESPIRSYGWGGPGLVVWYLGSLLIVGFLIGS